MAIRVEHLGDEPKAPHRWKGLFEVSEAGPEWEGHAELARDCERARLRKKQAEALRLRSCGRDWKVIAAELSLNPRHTEIYHRVATARLVQHYPRWSQDLLECFQNAQTRRKGNARLISTARVTLAADVH